jgi:hypothetical protein
LDDELNYTEGNKMNTLNKTLTAAAAALITSTGISFADGHTIDIDTARLDMSLDTNGDGEVDNDEMIAGNMAIFDTDGSGTLNAVERGVADDMLIEGNIAMGTVSTDDGADAMQIEFNVGAARLMPSLDTNGDSEVDDNEIIDGNMALFDTNADGAIDADERGVAEQLLMTGGNTISVDAPMVDTATMTSIEIDFDAGAARLMPSLDTNGDGEVDDNEIIEGNMSVFDVDGSGAIDAEERGVAEEFLMNN